MQRIDDKRSLVQKTVPDLDRWPAAAQSLAHIEGRIVFPTLRRKGDVEQGEDFAAWIDHPAANGKARQGSDDRFQIAGSHMGGKLVQS